MTKIIEVESKQFGKFEYVSENMEMFWNFVCERQNIYYRRFIKKLPPPWTNDEILKTYKFTNVHRSLDRTTIWYHDNIGGYNKNFPNNFNEKDVIFGTLVHRLFNKIETMQKLLPYMSIKTFDYDKVIYRLEKIRNSGESVWTDAHIVTGVQFGGFSDKLYNIMYLVKMIHDEIDNIHKSIKKCKSLEELYKAARNIQGFGPFLGYQLILDLINTGIMPFSHDDYVVAGPGCKRGIRHVFPKEHQISCENAMMFMRLNQKFFFERYNLKYKYLKKLGGEEKGIHLGDIENCFCEFSKYYKAYNDIGRPRNVFKPRKD